MSTCSHLLYRKVDLSNFRCCLVEIYYIDLMEGSCRLRQSYYLVKLTSQCKDDYILNCFRHVNFKTCRCRLADNFCLNKSVPRNGGNDFNILSRQVDLANATYDNLSAFSNLVSQYNAVWVITSQNVLFRQSTCRDN